MELSDADRFRLGPLPTDRGANSPTPPLPPAAVLAAGVDWLACTSGTPARMELLRSKGWQICYAEAEAGNDLRPWLWKGYEGITSGSAAVGVRHDGVFVKVSGGLAAECFNGVVVYADHVSRVDLAVTARLAASENPAQEAYRKGPPVEGRGRGRPITKGAHIETWTEGETVYLGGRKSDRYGRLYQKGLESGKEEYRDAWRWEVEFKGRASTPIAGAVSQCDSQAEAVLAFVWDSFASWGVPPVWGKGAENVGIIPPRPQTDDARRIAWLYSQVRPVISQLLTRHRLEEVIGALGLEEYLAPPSPPKEG